MIRFLSEFWLFVECVDERCGVCVDYDYYEEWCL